MTVVLSALFLSLFAAPGHAAAAPGISVSKATGLNPAGETITVRGSGFDVNKGIYVAICVDNGPGRLPTPCLGGADTSGGSGGSAWISSNPPNYGQGLTTPYGPGGSFSVTLRVVAVDPVTGTDCRTVVCAAVTRADHTRTNDRSQDTRVRLAFAAPAAPPQTKVTPPPTRAAPPVTTTAAPATTTTTPPASSSTAPTSSAATTSESTDALAGNADPGSTAEVVPVVGTATATSHTGWWIGGGVAVLAAAAAVVFLRVRRARRADPATTG